MFFKNFIKLFLIFVFSLIFQNILSFGPPAKRNIKLNDTLVINKDFNCNFTRYIPNIQTMGNGGRGEFQKPVIQVSNGAKLLNCIIGARKGYKSADGVHCINGCKLINIWHEKVGEDAITFLGSNPNNLFIIDGGGAQNAEGKVIQFDGAGIAKINNFYMKNVYEGICSCGNCEKQYKRRIEVNNLIVENLTAGQFIVAVNANFNDYAILKNIKIKGKSKENQRIKSIHVKYLMD
ncbi:hypothetical protein Mgra_00008269 [Meloidogyne graminicola]|uniref:Probable pectate lyase F n=1 Tax=Meloidogyne graminicola TaxID=189291 RepID=A0A8S9ZGA0_9BILA|nr:hypothetical protein Mgra_00008269 [Meloidogyne graminicola]